ncbi:hypothetical protein E4U42_001974 [Claviceps africana]|uniref:non-specific serine/threonine protein kinase n=1 Tax=Claviceps africana TaxID=83212 RepID=A0A8K0NMK9_9HYPO|nr:hypothetical protein E4U42_001974 [Claviceps africana]
MASKLLTKRGSCPMLDPVTRQPVMDQSKTDERRDGEQDGPDTSRSRPGSVKLLAEIRGAIRALKRTPYNCSDGSAVYEADRTRLSSADLEGQDIAAKPLTPLKRRHAGLSPKSLVKKLGFDNLVTSSNATVVLRGSSLRRRTSLQVLPSSPSLAFSDAVSSVSSLGTDKSSVVGNKSTGKTSLDSRYSETSLAKAISKRRRSRRHPWSKSSPDGGGNLQTIVEGCYQPRPTIDTVEKAAAAKIFLETCFNNLLNRPNPRTARLQYLETQLYYSPHLDLDEKKAIRQSFYYQETCHLRETRAIKAKSLMSLLQEKYSHADSYESLKILGRGSFGVVKLVRERADKSHAFPQQVFAMKVIRKSDMIRSCQEGHLRAERDFLVASEGSNWVVPLVASFQDLTSLYLVMEYMPGGDFLGLLIRENILHESVARFYVAEMILAVEEVHRLKFIHRDIKPDNFLISASGHLKISDFGLAFDGHWSHDVSYYKCQRYSLLGKLGVRVDGDEQDHKEGANISSQIPWLQAMKKVLSRHERKSVGNDDADLPGLLGWRNRCGNRVSANSVVGTSQYMAPESIGIILYECLYGHTPFFADDGRQQTKNNILDHKQLFSFPHRPLVSDKCKDLIFRLIQEKDIRLCSRRYRLKDCHPAYDRRYTDIFKRHVFPDDAEDIKAHRWFKNFPWDRIHVISPPFVPHITSLDDTHYFDESDPFSEPVASSDESEPADPRPEDIRWVLRECRPVVQNLAIELLATPYDSARLRSADRRIDRTFDITPEERKTLKAFVRMYKRKERKRPRDIVLRDASTKAIALNVRKRTAFTGYTWRRMRPGGYLAPSVVPWEASPALSQHS